MASSSGINLLTRIWYNQDMLILLLWPVKLNVTLIQQPGAVVCVSSSLAGYLHLQ